ncbi:MAG: hypothetical protein IJ800_03230 [Clostridia bacterium]|nr:hypothetical protein [Clostridia bacterium]
MIHSLSGGVIKDGGRHTFVKVKFDDGEERWYLSDEFSPLNGMKVAVNYNGRVCVGKVVRVDTNLSGQATPIPVKRAESVISVIFDEE